MSAGWKTGAWMGALTIALAGALVLLGPAVHEPCPFFTHCSFLPTSWEMTPDQTAIPFVETLYLSPPNVLPTPLDKPPR